MKWSSTGGSCRRRRKSSEARRPEVTPCRGTWSCCRAASSCRVRDPPLAGVGEEGGGGECRVRVRSGLSACIESTPDSKTRVSFFFAWRPPPSKQNVNKYSLSPIKFNPLTKLLTTPIYQALNHHSYINKPNLILLPTHTLQPKLTPNLTILFFYYLKQVHKPHLTITIIPHHLHTPHIKKKK